MDADVLVAGLGPVGQLAALLLARAGVRVVAVDRAAGPYELPRAAATDDEVLRILQHAGVRLDGLVEDPDVELVSARGVPLPVLAPRARPFGHPPLAFLHQAHLEAALCAALAGRPEAELRWGTAVERVAQDATGVTLTVRAPDGREAVLRGRALLGCDGARSLVRAACGIAFDGATAAQPWLVVDVEVAAPIGARPRAQFVGDVRRPAVNLPLDARHHRWEFLVLPGEDAAVLCAPDSVAALLAPWVQADRVRIRRAAVYTYEARAAARWRAGRVLLLGDAAHLMPPFAGQGMSSGLRDAANVAWKLAAVLQGRASEALLDTYEAERRPHVAAVTRLALFWGAVVQTRRARLAALRDAAVAGARRLPAVARAVEDYRLKPAPAFRAGAFSPARTGPWRRRPGGRLFPQPLVRAGDALVPLDEALGPGWALLGFGHAPWALLGAEDRALWEGLGARALEIRPAGGPARDGRIEDVEGVLGAWARRHDTALVVLRPDRVVFAATGVADAAAAAAAWRRWASVG